MNVEKILLYVGYGMLGLVGGMAKQILEYLRGKEFVWSIFFANLLLSSIVGSIVGNSMPADFFLHDTIIALSGVSAYQLLEFVENDGIGILKKIIEKKIK